MTFSIRYAAVFLAFGVGLGFCTSNSALYGQSTQPAARATVLFDGQFRTTIEEAVNAGTANAYREDLWFSTDLRVGYLHLCDGVMSDNASEIREAAAQFEEACTSRPTDPTAQLFAGLADLDLQFSGDSVRHLIQVRKDAAESAEANLTLASAYADMATATVEMSDGKDEPGFDDHFFYKIDASPITEATRRRWLRIGKECLNTAAPKSNAADVAYANAALDVSANWLDHPGSDIPRSAIELYEKYLNLVVVLTPLNWHRVDFAARMSQSHGGTVPDRVEKQLSSWRLYAAFFDELRLIDGFSNLAGRAFAFCSDVQPKVGILVRWSSDSRLQVEGEFSPVKATGAIANTFNGPGTAFNYGVATRPSGDKMAVTFIAPGPIGQHFDLSKLNLPRYDAAAKATAIGQVENALRNDGSRDPVNVQDIDEPRLNLHVVELTFSTHTTAPGAERLITDSRVAIGPMPAAFRSIHWEADGKSGKFEAIFDVMFRAEPAAAIPDLSR